MQGGDDEYRGSRGEEGICPCTIYDKRLAHRAAPRPTAYSLTGHRSPLIRVRTRGSDRILQYSSLLAGIKYLESLKVFASVLERFTTPRRGFEYSL